MKKHVVNLLTISVCFLFLFIIAAIVSLLPIKNPPINAEQITRVFAVSPEYFAPEPKERLIYVINTLLMPFLCAGFYILFSRQIKKENIQKVKLLSWIFSPVILYLLFYLAFLGLDYAPFKYIKPSGLIKYPWITFALNLALLAFWLGTHRRNTSWSKIFTSKRLTDILYWGLGSVILIFAGLEAVFNDAEPYVAHIHFIAYFDSMVQVYLGHQPYINVFPQYGLYAWFLNPVFHLIGLNVIKFTVVMGIFRILIYGSLLILFYRILDSKLVAFLCFATTFFYTRMRVPVDILNDPYFQYNPHRMIFPVLLIFSTWFYLNTKDTRTSQWLYVTNGILAAISVLWNLDTGMVVSLAWVSVLAYQELTNFCRFKLSKTIYHLFRHAVVIALIFGLVTSVFVASVYLSTGQIPRFTQSDDYVQLFYGLGYFMMPMMIVHPWNMVILTYIIGIYFSMRGLILSNQGQESGNSESNITNSFLFITSLVGIGLFNYYIGRSHEYNLVATVWPAYILLAIYVARLIKHVRPILFSNSFNWQIKLRIALRNSFQVGSLLALFYFLGSAPVSILGNLPTYVNLIQYRLSLAKQGRPPALLQDIKAIEETSSKEDTVFIISDYAPELYLYTQHTNPINIAGFGEIILRSDVEKIDAFLEKPPANAKIYWDKRFYDVNPYDFDINPYNFPTLTPEEIPSSENIILFVKKEK